MSDTPHISVSTTSIQSRRKGRNFIFLPGFILQFEVGSLVLSVVFTFQGFLFLCLCFRDDPLRHKTRPLISGFDLYLPGDEETKGLGFTVT